MIMKSGDSDCSPGTKVPTMSKVQVSEPSCRRTDVSSGMRSPVFQPYLRARLSLTSTPDRVLFIASTAAGGTIAPCGIVALMLSWSQATANTCWVGFWYVPARKLS